MNRVIEARVFLEEQQVGAFEKLCELAVGSDGVLVMMPECFLAGVPCAEDAGCIHIVFAAAELPTLYRVLSALPYEVVEWRRDFGHSAQYGTRRRRIADWGRKLGLAERISARE